MTESQKKENFKGKTNSIAAIEWFLDKYGEAYAYVVFGKGDNVPADLPVKKIEKAKADMMEICDKFNISFSNAKMLTQAILTGRSIDADKRQNAKVGKPFDFGSGLLKGRPESEKA